MRVTTAVSFAFVGHPMANMFSQVVKMTSFLSGLLLNLSSLRVAKAISPGSQLFASIRGVAMTETTDLDQLVTIADCYCGISVLACCIVQKL